MRSHSQISRIDGSSSYLCLDTLLPHPSNYKTLLNRLGRKKHDNYRRKVTGEVKAKICMIACSDPPDGRSSWTMQMIADELIRFEVVDYITDSTV